MAKDFFPQLFLNNVEEDGQGALEGRLPAYLNHIIIYNGPIGIRHFENGNSVKHWFDGLSMLTSFEIDAEKNTVNMHKRMLKSEAYNKAKLNDKLILTEYGTAGNSDPDRNILSRALATLNPSEMTDNCACNVYSVFNSKIGKKVFLASTETCLLRSFDIRTLETNEEKIDLSGLINIMSARPIMDPDSGEIFNIGASFGTGPKYHFVRIENEIDDEMSKKDDKKEKSLQSSLLASSSIVASIPSRSLSFFSYYHSLAMSKHYLIMIEQPWVVNTVRLASSKIKGVPFKECIDWKPEELNIFHMIDKKSGKSVNKFVYKSRKPFFFLNFVNAYEDENDQLVIDLIAYDSPDLIEAMYLEKLMKSEFDLKDESQLRRFVLPLKIDAENCGENAELLKNCPKMSAKMEQKTNIIWLEPSAILNETGCEHPSINRRFLGKRYKFCYVIGWLNSVNGGYFANAVTKVDVERGESVGSWQGDCFEHPCEAIFVEDPESANEDDGVVVVAVTSVREKSFLLVLDAKTMTEVARATFEQHVPFASHAFAAKNG